MDIDRIDKGIFRLRVPFETLTTSVYFYVCEQGTAIIDSATYPSDVDDYIVPALKECSIQGTDVKFLLLTHDHCDHNGGTQRLSEIFADARIGTSFAIDSPDRMELVDGETILGGLKAVFLPGHTSNSFGFYDAATKTLLSGDCLQLDGIGKYRDGIWNAAVYIDSINKLKHMDIRRIVAAHEYDPLGSVAEGQTAVENYLDACISIAKRKSLMK